MEKIPTRDELLSIKKELVKRQLIVCFYMVLKQAHFKVDAYTKRLLIHNKLINEKNKIYRN